MLSFSTEQVYAFWRNEDAGLAERFMQLEQSEDWAMDQHPEIASRLQALGARLVSSNAAHCLASADKDDLLFFLVYISSSKAFRLLRWLDEAADGAGSRLLTVLVERGTQGNFANISEPMLAHILLQRLRTIHNTDFFARLFSSSLLQEVSKAISAYLEERRCHET